jgi:aryl-alcohol dehydrogenase-like predicted oxidoreductase
VIGASVSGARLRVVLGTVQLGMPYGVSNARGQVPLDEARAMVDLAARSGVSALDTAHLYGEGEAVLGSVLPAGATLDVVTKTPKFGGAGADAQAAPAALSRAFALSLRRLRRAAVSALLVHDAADLLGPAGPAIWRAMEGLRDEGLVARLGVSVYSGAEIDGLLGRFPLDLVQLPFNLLDRRLVEGGQLGRLARRGVEVHARSVFLQGLLLMAPEALPPALADMGPRLARLRAALAEAGTTPLAAALAAAARRPEIGSVVVGATSAAELAEILAAAAAAPDPAVPDLAPFAVADETVLNPSAWAARLATQA